MDQDFCDFTLEDLDNIVNSQNLPGEAICPYFLQGRCMYGNKCWFRHPSNDQEIPGDANCAICLEKVKQNNRQFGLLLGCAHIFCLNCIRSWRGQINVPKEVSRSCPICRVPSFYILPSTDLVMRYEDKLHLAESYKKKLSSIPCQHFNFGDGECPFGGSCFYDHRYRNGQKWTPGPPQFACDEFGVWQVSKKPKLSEFLPFN
ncbi:unnamed protein product [Blepharisma stoltei]|uniref:RING-type E3 ubiquitin transferase n=1 Tax=Blepharisma stoltei TaxID=1481888 RepID=A0AAU9JHZ0_9CILI|nr:unnamed protein product [Blepharisma stoltei]